MRSSTIMIKAFMDGAKQREEQYVGKIYCYTKRSIWGDIKVSGRCTVKSVRYDATEDCEIIRCEDIVTKKIFSSRIFDIELEEVNR